MITLARLLVLVMLVTTTGCMTTQPVDFERGPQRRIYEGEELTVYLKDGTRLQMLVGKVTDGELIGSEPEPPYRRMAFRYDDIEAITADRVDGGRTVGAALLGLIIIPPLMALWMLSEGDWCWGSSC